NAQVITVQATDGTNTTDITVNLNETPQNDNAPVAVDDEINAIEDTVFTSTIDLDANDTDLDGDALSVTPGTFTTVKGGTLVLASDGSYTYTPAVNFNGVDTVNYTVTDGTLTDIGTLTITVAPVNDTPVASVSNITMNEDTTYSFALSDFGFSDIDGDSLSYIRIDSLPVMGQLLYDDIAVTQGQEIDAASIDLLTFTPALHDSGSDQYSDDIVDQTSVGEQLTDYAVFNFSVSDGLNWSESSSTMTVDVDAVADAPTLSVTGETTTLQTIDISNVTSTTSGFNVTALDVNGIETTVSTHTTYPEGFGVSGAASNGADSELGGSEKLVVTFDNLVSSVDVSFAWMNDTESASYTFYKDGVEVGYGESRFGDDGIEAVETLQATDGASFDTIVFAAPYSNDDYLINSITYEKVETNSDPLVLEENSSVAFNIESALADTDGSESLNLELRDIPDGFTISDGTHTFTADASTTSVNITDWTYNALTLTAPAVDATTIYTLNVVATSTEYSNSDTASTTLPISVTVTNNANQMTLEDNLAQVNESAMSYGTDSASTDEVATGNILSDDILPVGGALTSINGVSADVNGIITVVTADGNTLVVNADVTSANYGEYTYTLLSKVNHPVTGNDTLVDTFTYTVTAADGSSSTADLAVTIVDDVPIVNNTTAVSLSIPEAIDTNIVLTLDVSGSMNTDVTITQTRFDIAKAALIDTINAYDAQGDVNVNLTLFNSGAVNLGWMSTTEALDYLSKLTMSGSYINYDGSSIEGLTNFYTNYEAAVDVTPSTYNTNLPSADRTVAYFISDGAPNVENIEGKDKNWNVGNDAESGWLDTPYVTQWTTFINNNNIDLNVIGIGTNLDSTYLDMVQVVEGKDALIITEETQLSSTILAGIESIEGSLYGDNGTAGINFGADGGHIVELTYIDQVNGSVTYTYDASNPVQTIELSEGNMALNFDTGTYIYTPIIASENDITENFSVTVTDNDGDIATNNLDLVIGIDETYIYDAAAVDGGAGLDTLVLDEDNLTIDFSALSGNISNIETINLSGANQDITLHLDDVLNITDSDNALRIDGLNGDTINIDTVVDGSGEWIFKDEITDAQTGQTYNHYSSLDDTVTLEISTQITIDES
ncbi:MAG: Ig-like domain-containing protein, partial [Sulfurimonas sp.]|nr:Ig-like domain-containing protein [Sulfurimonas sp.]